MCRLLASHACCTSFALSLSLSLTHTHTHHCWERETGRGISSHKLFNTFNRARRSGNPWRRLGEVFVRDSFAVFSGFDDCFPPVSMDSGLERFEDFELHLFLRGWIVYSRFIPPLHDNTRQFYSPQLFERV